MLEHDEELAAQDDALQGAAHAGALAQLIKSLGLPALPAAAHHREAVVLAPHQHLHHVVHPLNLPETPAT